MRNEEKSTGSNDIESIPFIDSQVFVIGEGLYPTISFYLFRGPSRKNWKIYVRTQLIWNFIYIYILFYYTVKIYILLY